MNVLFAAIHHPIIIITNVLIERYCGLHTLPYRALKIDGWAVKRAVRSWSNV